MKVALLIQNLSHATDSVGYDCIFQYNIIREYLGEAADIRIFAEVSKPGLHPNVTIHPFAGFWEFQKANPDAKIIYHFCDGWDGVDEVLAQQGENCFIRWHNITPPWFYAFQSDDFTWGCLRGYSVISKIGHAGSANFLVNSEFSRRQLEAFDGPPARIHTVFPGSPIIGKRRLGGDRGPQVLDPGQPLDLLFVGRVVPHKGNKHVISVAHAVQTFLGRPVRVTFVGSLDPRLKNYWTELQEIADRLSVKVVFTDAVPDDALIGIYRKSHVFVCMSEHEGFGMPVFEAMRSKVPVVCWASSAFSELLKNHPLASPIFNIAWFAAAVCATLDPTIRAHVLACQESYLNAYNRDVIAAQLLRAVFGVTGVRPAGERHASRVRLNDRLRTPLAALRAGWRDAGEHLHIVESRNARIDRCVSDLAGKIEAAVGSAIKIFPHDASTNYVSLYDIPVYQKVLNARRQEKWRQDIGSAFDVAIEPCALHPHADIIAHLSSGQPAMSLAPIDRLETLLSFDDVIFVKLACRTLLDSEPDPGACLHYLGKLRRGVRKEEILAELAALPEARRVGRRLAGFAAEAFLAAPPERARRRSVFGWLRRRKAVRKAAPPSAADPIEALRLERLEDGVNRLVSFLTPTLGAIAPTHPMGSIHHVYDLLRLNQRPFIERSFQVILGRAADPDAIEYYLNALRGGLKRQDVLVELARSDEGRPRVGRLGGLQELVAAADAGLPYDGLPARIGRIENDLGQLIQTIIARQVPGLRAEDAAGSLLRRSLGHGIRIPSAAPQALLAAAPESVARPAQAVKLLHQILITQEGTVPDTLPPLVSVNAESLRAHHPGATYKLWGLDEIRRFIAEHFEREVLDAFDTLKAFALKADLARYCILYVEGGLYSDLSNRFLNPLMLAPGRKIACFREHKPLHGVLWLTQNTIIYAEPGQPEIRLAIDLVIANVRNRDYGVNSLAPSGPALFGRVFAAVDRPALYQIGQAINLQVDGGLNRACYVASDGTLIAVRLQGGGGRPNELGLKGTNIYGLMWDRREIYGENRLYFPYDHPSMRGSNKTEGAPIPIRAEDTGHCIYGPYIDLPPGQYVATVRFDEPHGEGKLTLDVCGRTGGMVFAQRDALTPDSEGRISIPFTLEEHEFAIEIRVHSKGGFSGLFRELTIVRADLAPIETSPPPGAAQAPSLDPPPVAGEPIVYLHQILGAAATGPDGGLAAALRRDVALARELHPLAEYRAWDDTSLRDFIVANFAADVLAAYDRLAPFACRADLARYCLLYALGGIVADPGIRFVNPLTVPKGRTIVAFRSARPDDGAPWAVDTGLLYAAPGQAEVKEAIEAIISHTRAAGYGAAPESVTGGDLFGRILAVACDARRYVAGETVELTAGYPVENICYLGGDGRLVGVRLGHCARIYHASMACSAMDSVA